MNHAPRLRIDVGASAVLVLAAFAFALSIILNRSVFERLPHLEDEFAYLYQARIFARGQAWVPREEPVKVFWQPFVIQPEQTTDGVHKRFGKYTPGWPLLLAPGAALGAPWFVNACFAALNIALTYRLGREIFNRRVGLVAVLLLAVSPMAVLLNATLMAHPSAMFLTMLFLYAYWRIVGRPGSVTAKVGWGAGGGLALGLLLASRPLTAAALATPVVVFGAVYLLILLARARGRFLRLLPPLVVMALCVAPFGLLWPVFNQIWTGDWRTNVYTLQWPYDRVGFGVGYGPNQREGHTLAKGWRNARNDLKFYFRDLFGLTLDPDVAQYAEANLGYGAGVGLSYVLIIAGLVAGRRSGWAWLLFLLFLSLVAFQLAYWIGSSVNNAAAYSVRYYFEATFAVCLISAFGVVAVIESVVASRRWRAVGYAVLLMVCGASFFGYTPARLREPLPPRWNDGLWRYNGIGQHQLDEIRKMREKSGNPTQPVLIVVLRDPTPGVLDDWRTYGAAMALTSPFLDGDIVVARVFEREDVATFTRRFPDRLVLYQIGNQLYLSVEDL